MIDRVGVKIGYSLAMAAWSLAVAAHGFARSIVEFSLARAVAGFQRLTGRILEGWPNGYAIILAIASVIYLVALLCIHLISPRLTPFRAADGDE